MIVWGDGMNVITILKKIKILNVECAVCRSRGTPKYIKFNVHVSHMAVHIVGMLREACACTVGYDVHCCTQQAGSLQHDARNHS